MNNSEEPLIFHLPQTKGDPMEVLIQQIPDSDSEQHKVGFVMWPSSVLLARWILQHPSTVTEYSTKGDILELGAGCGLVGLAVASMIRCNQDNPDEAKTGDSTDINVPIHLTDYSPAVLQNLRENIKLNGLEDTGVTVSGLDFFDQPGNCDAPKLHIDKEDQDQGWIDMAGKKRPQVGLILASDIIVYSNDALMVANTIEAALAPGGKAIVVSAGPQLRFGVGGFQEACENIGLEVTMTEFVADHFEKEARTDTEFLTQDLEQTSGYKSGYKMLMFSICKCGFAS